MALSEELSSDPPRAGAEVVGIACNIAETISGISFLVRESVPRRLLAAGSEAVVEVAVVAFLFPLPLVVELAVEWRVEARVDGLVTVEWIVFYTRRSLPIMTMR